MVVAVAAGLAVNLVVQVAYGDLPPLPLLAGLTPLVLGMAELVLAAVLRARIRRRPGSRPVDALATARAVALAKASSVAGAVLGGAWLGVLAYVLPLRGQVDAAGADTAERDRRRGRQRGAARGGPLAGVLPAHPRRPGRRPGRPGTAAVLTAAADRSPVAATRSSGRVTRAVPARGYPATMSTPDGELRGRAGPDRRRAALLATAATLAALAAAAVVLADDARWLRLGVVAALWAAVVAGIVVARHSRGAAGAAEAAQDAAADLAAAQDEADELLAALRRDHDLQLAREAAAREESERAAEKAREDAASLREQLERMRVDTGADAVTLQSVGMPVAAPGPAAPRAPAP